MIFQNNDVIVFKNGNTMTYEHSEHTKFVFENFYNPDLTCKTNDGYTIVKVFRPTYEEIYNRDDIKNKRR